MAYRSDRTAQEARIRRLRARLELVEREERWILSLPEAMPGPIEWLHGGPETLKRWRELRTAPSARQLQELAAAAYGVDGEVPSLSGPPSWVGRTKNPPRLVKAWVAEGPDGVRLQIWDTGRGLEPIHLPAAALFVLGALTANASIPVGLFILLLAALLFAGARRTVVRKTRQRACQAILLEESLLQIEHAAEPARYRVAEEERVDEPAPAREATKRKAKAG